MFPLTPMERPRSTPEQMADQIIAHILEGRFTPGDRIQVDALAAEFGVARNTTREAIRILEQSGLVVVTPKRGAVLVTPTPDSIDDVYNARRTLEVAAVTSVVSETSFEDLDTAYHALARTARSGTPSQIVSTDLDFHAAIVRLMGNAHINRFFESLVRELRFYLMVLSVSDREFESPDELIQEHHRLLVAIQSGDRAAAAAAVSHHIDFNHRRLKQISGQAPLFTPVS